MTSRRPLGIRADVYDNFKYDGTEFKKFQKMPYLNKFFAFGWMGADCLFFVGMLGPQSSPLTETVAYVCSFIFLCRAFQFAGTFFMDAVLFDDRDCEKVSHHDKEERGNLIQDTHEKQPRTHEPNLIAACLQLCSFWCFVVVCLHFELGIRPAYDLQRLGIGNQTYGVQITFIIAMAVLECARHFLLFYTVVRGPYKGTYLVCIQSIFTLDTIVRTVLAMVAIVEVKRHLGQQNDLLRNFLAVAG